MSTSTKELTVKDVALPLDRFPTLGRKVLFKEALEAMNKHRLGIACIVDDGGHLLGILTDGDVRRMLLKDQKPFAALFADDALAHSVQKPTVTAPDDSLVAAVQAMEAKEVWDLPVVAADGRLTGLLHLHPAIKSLLGI